MTAQATVARIGHGPVLAAILAATAVVGFGIGIWIGSQPSGSVPAGPAALATSPPSPTPTPSMAPPSPTLAPTASASPVDAAGPREIVLRFDGTAHDVSPPFEVVGGWQIQWQTDGASLAIAVTGDQNLGVVVDEPGPASGVRSMAPAGNVRLDVAANGPWSITIIQGDEPTASPT